MVRSFMVAAAAVLLAGQVYAGRTGYDVQKNILTIPSIELDGVRHNFAKVRIVSVEVVDVGVVSQAPADLHVCVPGVDPITQEKLNAIQIGMTLDEVNQIMGCQYNPPTQSVHDNCIGCADYPFELFYWGFALTNAISVRIDNITHRVIDKSGTIFG